MDRCCAVRWVKDCELGVLDALLDVSPQIGTRRQFLSHSGAGGFEALMATIWASMQVKSVVIMVQMEYLLFVVAIGIRSNQSEI